MEVGERTGQPRRQDRDDGLRSRCGLQRAQRFRLRPQLRLATAVLIGAAGAACTRSEESSRTVEAADKGAPTTLNATWQRQLLEADGGRPLLSYAVFGEFQGLPQVSRSSMRSWGATNSRTTSRRMPRGRSCTAGSAGRRMRANPIVAPLN